GAGRRGGAGAGGAGQGQGGAAPVLVLVGAQQGGRVEGHLGPLLALNVAVLLGDVLHALRVALEELLLQRLEVGALRLLLSVGVALLVLVVAIHGAHAAPHTHKNGSAATRAST